MRHGLTLLLIVNLLFISEFIEAKGHRRECWVYENIKLNAFRLSVQKGIAEGAIQSRNPTFRLNRHEVDPAVCRSPSDPTFARGDLLYLYDLGGERPIFSSDITPIDRPTSLQTIIEGLRKCGNYSFWNRPILKAEMCVGASLNLIATHRGSREDLLQQLVGLQQTGYDILDSAVRNWAVSNGMKPLRTGPCGAAGYFYITISTFPKGARVYQLDKWKFDTLGELAVANDYRQWREIGSTVNGSINARLTGRCHFLIWWPEKQRWYTSAVYEIDKNGKIDFIQ